MQPYFFPYAGYFSLIAHTDKWVVFDSSQYTAKTWMNRNRIANLEGEWSYISLPVHKTDLKMNICDAEVVNFQRATKKILGSLKHYKGKAPFYEKIYTLVEKTLVLTNSASLTDINVSGIAQVCDYLDIPFNYVVSSKESIDFSNISHPGQWALEISKHYNADTYINPIGGRDIFKPAEFKQAGITLSFLEPPCITYTCQPPFSYFPHLSIIDALMWCKPQEIRDAIEADTKILKETA